MADHVPTLPLVTLLIEKLMRDPENAYWRALDVLNSASENFLISERWNRNYLDCLDDLGLMLVSEPTKTYHVMAPLPVRESPDQWPPNQYIVEKPDAEEEDLIPGRL